MILLIDPIPFLQTNIIRIVWQSVRRTTNESVGVNGLTLKGTTLKSFQ